MASKNQKAAQARAAAQAQAKALAKARERRTTVMVIAVSVLVLAVVGGLIFFIVNSSKAQTLADVHAPAGADATGGILVGPANGTLRVDLYTDFMCPGCGMFEEVNGAVLPKFSAAGDASTYYHPISFLDKYSNGTKYSSRAANAAAVVADQAPEHFVAFFAALFADQPDEGSDGLSDQQIADIAVGAGVPQAVADTFVNGEFADWVVAATEQSSIDGVATTPGVMIDGVIVKQTDVNYLTPGVLEPYLNSLLTE